MPKFSSRLGREIVLVLLIKLALIAAIWQLWFSDRTPVDPQRVAMHLSANQQGGSP
ncbi:hypothetical protein QU481_08010 [Crenobacter sp. SG2303]|uniref:Uncharacterized protein n=1 Tax=Crenobacter oryzisoli TaxID=3056844 RepID=A0ABT7XM27_9NEIS|nr:MULTISPECIES: cytochrome oxidase putative small subunit CydP [unclassified Crenobacter]MDN0074836.1 hypothetical protein [Crenobacter sp. SG2303]MDN0082082.1 hypothetical protein [Crenobacter sp. SG2305]